MAGSKFPEVADTTLADQPEDAVVTRPLLDRGATPLAFQTALAEPYATPGARQRRIIVPPHQSLADPWSVARSDNWYDLTLTAISDPHFLRRYVGMLGDGGAGRNVRPGLKRHARCSMICAQ
ncbi:phospholipase domain-containing protein [Sphingomonas sp. PAMC 26617]|uniref:phospholipase domain-containing protein n=1 Tax=Sphingomonas sp. PAMC 26617 TaxID=1112216 RepID=UPI0002889C04|nr:phospholipase domain-containing protein [Sphingomonas sp. PAMC 26617]